jgi:DmsE family decaheme c-type cytochrome
MLREPTLAETCYTCHAEKRGPFLWEHAPAREDCSICHQPHGSIHTALLNTRGPWLCQQCHLGSHSSAAFDGTGIPPQGTRLQMLGKNCLNCHSQVHGSNNPSGATFTR